MQKKKKNTIIEETKRSPIILKITRVEVTPQGRTERELTPEEVEQWKKEHGYDNSDAQTQSDSE